MSPKNPTSFKFRYMERIVGFFVLIGILILFITVILMGREQRWFQSKSTYYAIFNNASSLSSGIDVRIKGLNVGKVDSIRFSEDNRIQVRFSIYDSYVEKVRTDSYVFKGSTSPLGGGFLDVTIGERGQPVEMNGELLSEDNSLVQYMLAMDMFPDRSSPLDRIIGSVDKLFAELSDSDGDLMVALGDLSELSSMLVSSKGSINTFLNDDNALFNEVFSMLSTVKKITHDLQILSATLRNSSPSLHATILEAEQGIKETTRVMVGLQQYLDIQQEQRSTSGSSQIEAIQIDRRNQSY